MPDMPGIIAILEKACQLVKLLVFTDILDGGRLRMLPELYKNELVFGSDRESG